MRKSYRHNDEYHHRNDILRGLNENIHNWIYLLEHRFKTEKLKGELQTDYAVEYMRDGALETYKRLFPSEDETPTWAEVKQEFLNTFVPFNHQMEIRNELKKLKQGNGEDAFNMYVHDFNRLINKSDGINEHDQMMYFMNGLSPYTVKRVQETCPENLKECMRRAAAIANASQNYPKSVESDRSEQRPREARDTTRIQCYRCNQYGHYRSKCPNQEVQSSATSARFQKPHQQITPPDSHLLRPSLRPQFASHMVTATASQ